MKGTLILILAFFPIGPVLYWLADRYFRDAPDYCWIEDRPTCPSYPNCPECTAQFNKYPLWTRISQFFWRWTHKYK